MDIKKKKKEKKQPFHQATINLGRKWHLVPSMAVTLIFFFFSEEEEEEREVAGYGFKKKRFLVRRMTFSLLYN